MNLSKVTKYLVKPTEVKSFAMLLQALNLSNPFDARLFACPYISTTRLFLNQLDFITGNID